MKKLLITTILLVLFLGLKGQTISSTSEIEKKSGEKEYKIKTHLEGLEGVKFARIKFSIPENVNVALPSGAKLQQTATSKFVSNYIYAVGSEGTADFEFIVFEPEAFNDMLIGVHLQYSMGTEKKDVLFDPIEVKKSIDYASFTDDSGFTKAKVEGSVALNKGEESHSNPKATEVKPKSKPVAYEKGNSSVQILSLADYNEKRVKQFCRVHDLKFSDLIKREVNGATKLSIGRLSAESAQVLKKKIVEENKVDGAFVVELK